MAYDAEVSRRMQMTLIEMNDKLEKVRVDGCTYMPTVSLQ